METFRYLPGVSTLRLDAEVCIGCGMCSSVCPHSVFVLRDKKAEIIDHDACIECGGCSANCPVEAITVNPGVGCAAYIIQKWLKGSKAAGLVKCC